MPKFVTRTGRAKSTGRTTRFSKQRKSKTDSRPLPLFVYGCHPMRASPRPVHPGCVSSAPWMGAAQRLSRIRHAADIFALLHLSAEPGDYALHGQDNALLGYTNDLTTALTVVWSNRLQKKDVTLLCQRPITSPR